jgi:phage-related protein
MLWKIEFYDPKVERAIEEWPKGMRAKFYWVSRSIREIGPKELGMPHIKSLKQGLFEIRVQSHEGIGRALFCIVDGKVVVVLSEFIKKTQKTPNSELELARKRMKEVKKNG